MGEHFVKYLKHLGNRVKTLADSSEDEILSLIRKIFPKHLLQSDFIHVPAFVDDACVINSQLISDNYELVVTSDVLVEGSDFLFDWMPSFDLGLKSLAVNLSDLASMGAEPLGMVVVVGANRNFSLSEMESFIHGLCEQASKYNVLLLGGDLSASEIFFVNITLLGKVPKGKSLRRDDIKVNDMIAVTGLPGEARAGFEIVSGKAGNVRSEERFLTNRFFRPESRLDVSYILRDSQSVRGCMDISDGLARDLARLSNLNNLKAVIYADLLPVSKLLQNFWTERKKSYIEMICRGGEDFELLFSVPEENFENIKTNVERYTGVKITSIGKWQPGQGVCLVMPDGKEIDISDWGFDHFAK